jgi:hypothetical protein
LTGDGRLDLPGTGGYLDQPNGLISGLTNATFEGWVTWNGGSFSQRIFDFGNNSLGENLQGIGRTYLMLTPKTSAGAVRFAISTNSAVGEMPTTWTNTFPIGQRAHIAVSYNSVVGGSSLYLNGQRVATGPASIPLRAITDINVWLGRSNWADPSFNGFFDEFRIYNGALSDSAVASSYAAGPDALLGGRPALLVSRSGNTLQISWPPDAIGYALEKTTILQPATSWTPVTNNPVLQGGRQTLNLPITNQNQFFRLRQ